MTWLYSLVLVAEGIMIVSLIVVLGMLRQGHRNKKVLKSPLNGINTGAQSHLLPPPTVTIDNATTLVEVQHSNLADSTTEGSYRLVNPGNVKRIHSKLHPPSPYVETPPITVNKKVRKPTLNTDLPPPITVIKIEDAPFIPNPQNSKYEQALKEQNLDGIPFYSGAKDPDRFFEKTLRQQVFDRYGSNCCVCWSGKELEVDHIVPHSRGGRTIVSNGQVLCEDCNISKLSRTQQEWENTPLYWERLQLSSTNPEPAWRSWDLVVKEWANQGKHRLYVNHDERTVGWLDLAENVVHCSFPPLESRITNILDDFVKTDARLIKARASKETKERTQLAETYSPTGSYQTEFLRMHDNYVETLKMNDLVTHRIVSETHSRLVAEAHHYALDATRVSETIRGCHITSEEFSAHKAVLTDLWMQAFIASPGFLNRLDA